MSLTTIANRYANALADVITSRNEVEQVSSELNGFVQLTRDNRELHEVFSSPAIALERKRGVLTELLSRLNYQQTTNNFLQLLLANYRLHHLAEILTSLAEELDKRRGVVSAEVVTARPLNDADRQVLLENLRVAIGREIRPQFSTDPEIIGGVVARVGSLIYDGSIKTRLNQMKQQLSKG
jgi:F-type H+-transporting ATPase subunit delta